uniref:NADH-ubiquinone oxidoreductase chain 4L n=1 Tax=Moricella rufonota TaxID=1384683 RepID=A0A897G155_9HYME|nr:NADH dehydrogenase subunit 4L [Moricella rufonota]
MLSYFNFISLFFILYFIGLMSLCFNRFHLLMLLLSLEFIVLTIYMLMIFYLMFFEMEMYFSILFLSFSVCEGVLGLSILINMVRMNGNDYFQVLNFL